MIQVAEHRVTKNRGLTVEGVPTIRLVFTDPNGEIIMKTKVKRGNVDHVVAELPRDDCFSRLDNWRKLLCGEPGQGRPVRLHTVNDAILQADLYVGPADVQEWDSLPTCWPGEGWLPFYFAPRHKE